MASRIVWINVGAVDSVGAATITATADTITVTGHGLADGDLVAFDTLVDGADGPLEVGVTYFVRGVSGDDFQVSGARGGNAVEFDTDGTAAVYTAVPSYSAEELRQIGSHALYHGSANRVGAREGVRPGAGDPVTVAGGNYQIQTHTGVIEPAGSTTQGPYTYIELQGTATALNPADGSNPRIDALDVQVSDDDADGSGGRGHEIVYVPGTPAGTPTAPALTARSYRLATITVPAGDEASATILELAPWTVASGGVLPVRNEDELPALGTYGGMAAFQQDTGAFKLHDGTDWNVAASVQGYQYWQTIVVTSSTSFIKADYPGLRAVGVQCQGGGSGGGGAGTTDATQASSGTGGRGGNWAWDFILESALLSSETATVGAGGAGGNGVNGSDGGASSFGSHVSADGGAGGQAAGASVGWGGADPAVSAGSATGAYIKLGSCGDVSMQNGGEDMAWSGAGGDSPMGGGGRGRRSSSTLGGGSGAVYGGGGGGAANGNAAANQAGGDGAQGIIVIDLYV